jgi:hypothetical protein
MSGAGRTNATPRGLPGRRTIRYGAAVPTRDPLPTTELNHVLELWDQLVSHEAGKRTSLTSGLIPVREYVGYAGIEAWYRWPGIYRRLDAAVPAEELGRRMRGVGTMTTTAHAFALPVIPFGGWKAAQAMGAFGLLPAADADAEAERVRTIVDYWIRWTEAWRGDGFRTCWDAGGSLHTCDRTVIDTLAASAVGVDTPEANRSARRFVAGLQQYLFLLYLDTRLGTGDSGPYPLPGGRTMIVREYSALAESWIPWSGVGASVPHGNLVVGLVFRPGVSNRVNDLSSTFSVPADNLAWLEAMAVAAPTPDGGLVPVDPSDLPGILAEVRTAQAACYRMINGWSFEEKVRNGAHVYFRGLLYPFTKAAGIDDDIDWNIPGADAGAVLPIFAGGLPEDPDADKVAYPMFPRLPG